MRRTEGCDLLDIARHENLSIVVADLDVDEDASVARFFATSVAGSEPIDILINNAGILSVDALEGTRRGRSGRIECYSAGPRVSLSGFEGRYPPSPDLERRDVKGRGWGSAPGAFQDNGFRI